MDDGGETKRTQGGNGQTGGLEEVPQQERITLEISSGGSEVESEGEIGLLEVQVIEPKERFRFLEETREMLTKNDSRLKYLLDGDAIENPFAVDREVQLAYLVNCFCEEGADGQHICILCNRGYHDFEDMHRHLLRHSNSKFYLCVLCLEGFSTLMEMGYHVKTHLEGEPTQAPDNPRQSAEEEVEGGRKLLEELAIDPEDEARILEAVEEMLLINDPKLSYVLDGEAIVNPFAPDREKHLNRLMSSFCEKRTGSVYYCTVCDLECDDLDEMHHHLLRHSNWKFFFCVRCLDGFYTLSETAYHTMAHIEEEVLLPMPSSQLVGMSKSPENQEAPQPPTPKKETRCPTEEQRSEDYRCTTCGYTFDRLDIVLSHAEQEHPTERGVINRLRLRLLRAAFDPNGYRLRNADENESA